MLAVDKCVLTCGVKRGVFEGPACLFTGSYDIQTAYRLGRLDIVANVYVHDVIYIAH